VHRTRPVPPPPASRLQEASADADAALISRINAAINAPLGEDGGGADEDGDDVMDEEAGDAPERDALLRGALAT
jgi:hypothetical protein